MQALMNRNGSSACNCNLVSWLFTDNGNCAFLEGKEVGQRQAYTPCLSPLENSQVAERNNVAQPGSKSYFISLFQNSVLVSTLEMRAEGDSFSLSQYKYISLWQCSCKGFFSEPKNRDL